jgi:ankyrin repeat protein
MRQLLEDGAHVNARDEQLETPLIIVASASYADSTSLELLLQAGADPNLASLKTTALMAAVYSEWENGVRILLAGGADPDSGLEIFGSGPLHVAASYGLDAILRLLIEYGADVNATDTEGKTARNLALEFGEMTAEKLLRAAEGTYSQ